MSASVSQALTQDEPLVGDGDRVVFLHIPKTAGSTLHAVLSPHFEKAEICPERFDGINVMTEEQLSQYRYFSGHFSRRSVERIPGPCKVFTFLRSPEERILSLYYFWRSHKSEVVEAGNLVGPRFARSLDLADFLECDHEAVTSGIDNAMTRQMVGQDAHQHFEEYRLNDPDLLIRDVIDYLDSLALVGFQENFRDDFDKLLSVLNIPQPASIPTVNSRAKNSSETRFEKVEEQTITDRVKESLLRLTDIDRQVYSQAVSLFGGTA